MLLLCQSAGMACALENRVTVSISSCREDHGKNVKARVCFRRFIVTHIQIQLRFHVGLCKQRRVGSPVVFALTGPFVLVSKMLQRTSVFRLKLIWIKRDVSECFSFYLNESCAVAYFLTVESMHTRICAQT